MSGPTPAARSGGSRLSRGGRIRRQWDAALAEPDAARALARLREIAARLAEHPAEAARSWAPFAESMTAERFHPLLTEQDFAALERTGRTLAEAGTVPLERAWRPLVAARRARGQLPQAAALLTQLYWAGPDAAPQAAVAGELAGTGARGDDQLAVYRDVFQRDAARPPEVLALAAEVFRTGFDSDRAELRQAAELAEAVGTFFVPGADRAAGLHQLLVHGDPGRARVRLATACAADPADDTALLGLLAAHIQDGSTAEIPAATLDAARARPGTLAGMAALCAALTWFDSGTDDSPPVTAQRLGEVDLARYAGPWPAYARGRLQLLAGDAEAAHAELAPIARAHPQRLLFAYHAAWAELLREDGESLGRRIAELAAVSENWPLICLLLDADPAAAQAGTAVTRLVQLAPPDFVGTAVVRKDLAAGRRPAGPPRSPDEADGGGPAWLETLRTALGEAAGHPTQQRLRELLRHPLFRRLPRADRLLWSGLLALRAEPDDPAEADRLLAEASRLGQRRGRLVRAAHHLEQGRAAEALTELEGRPGTKAALLRAWAETVSGTDPETVRRRLEHLPDSAAAQPHHLRGLLRLRQLRSSGAIGAPAGSRLAQLAARDLRRAVAAGADEALGSAGLLAAATVLAGETAAAEGGPAGPPALSDAGDAPWSLWIAGIAELAEHPERATAELGDRLLTLAERTHRMSGRTVIALAAVLTRVTLLSPEPETRQAYAGLLERLARHAPVPDVRRLAGLGATAVWVRGGPGSAPATVPHQSPPPAVEPLQALSVAGRALAARERAVAQRWLEAAQHGDGPTELLCRMLAAALAGRPLEPRALPGPPDGTGPAVAPLLEIARAAALAPGDAAGALDALLPHLAEEQLAGLATSRLLPGLAARLAHTQRGRRRRTEPHPLARAVARMAQSPGGGLDLPALARCATAAGDYDLARRLWQRAGAGRTAGADGSAEYARLLVSELVRDWDSAQPLRMAGLLREAARLSPAAAPGGSAARTGRGPDRGTLSAMADDLRDETFTDGLLRALFPGTEPPAPPWPRPGRYPALARLMRDTARLREAVETAAGQPDRSESRDQDRRRTAAVCWQECLRTVHRDVRLHHTLAVVCRERLLADEEGGDDRLAARTTVLWVSLLGSGRFWTAHHGRPEADEELRATVLRELFARHSRRGLTALRQNERQAARRELELLDGCRSQPGLERQMARLEFTPEHLPQVDQWPQTAALAGEFVEQWFEDIHRAAQRTVEAVPGGDPAAGVEQLLRLDGLGVPVPAAVLSSALNWAGIWGIGLFNDEQDRAAAELRTIADRTQPFADRIKEFCTPGEGHEPRNQGLSKHFLLRGLTAVGEGDRREATRMGRAALYWDPANESANTVLSIAERL
jgi:hypothetical protein